MNRPGFGTARGRCGAVLAGLVAMAVSGDLKAVNILSRDLQISGNWNENWYTYDDDQAHSASGSFHHATTAGSSLSANVLSAPHGWGRAGGGVGSFSLNLHADSAPGWLDYDWGIGALDPTGINIQAASVTRFQPTGTQLTIGVEGFADFNYWGDEQDMQVSLFDVTGSTYLLNLTASADWFTWQEEGFSALYSFGLDPSHEYELVLSGWITSWDDKYADMNVQVRLIPVPDAGATVVLLAVSVGFLLVFGARRRGKPTQPR